MGAPADISDPRALAAHAVQSLLRGSAPNGVAPADCGNWRDGVQGLYDAHAHGGTPAVLRTYDLLCRADRAWYGLVSAAAPAPDAADVLRAMPALPAEAQAVYAHAAPCAAWLDDYIAVGRLAAPMMVDSFHEAAGLFAVSTAIARRLVWQHRMAELYPSLYVLFIADSGYGKTTSFKLLRALIDAAGLNHLSLGDETTPENIISKLSTAIPPTFDRWEAAVRDQWLRERAFAAQRAWMVDEVDAFYAGLQRDYQSGISGLLRRFYDCPPSYTRETQGGGRVMVENIALNFFGAATTVGMRPYLGIETQWHNGMWPRHILLAPDATPAWVDADDEDAPMRLPPSLVTGLRRVYKLFPIPRAELVEPEKGALDQRPYVVVHHKAAADPVVLAPGVLAAHEAYRKATSHTLRASPRVDELLQGTYARFAERAMKIAMLLAVLDAEALPVVIELRHWARAQQIVERHRALLHRLWVDQVETDQVRLSERVMQKLRDAAPASRDARTLQQLCHIKTARETKEILGLLVEAGVVVEIKIDRKTAYAVPTEAP